MIVPSIDLMGGRAVQLVGGEGEPRVTADPRPLAERFGRVGRVAVIDLDAARSEGDNTACIRDLIGITDCVVGGGIRSVERAEYWLDAGARQVILGTMAQPDILAQLPRERVVAALDARDGEVVVDGWRTPTGQSLEDRIGELAPYVGGFLITFVEREGRLGGTDLQRAQTLIERAGSVKVTFAGGITTPDEVRILDHAGADAQVGMALYTDRMTLADAFAAPIRTRNEDGLWPTAVVDEHDQLLGLVHSNRESLHAALDEGRGIYWSRSRDELWRKGETSGNHQELLHVDLDCDRDALRFRVRQHGVGFCHLARHTCFDDGAGVPALARRLAARLEEAPPGSYTRRLLDDPALLRSKLIEEAGELADADGPDEVAHEVADVVYFALVAMARGGVRWAEVERTLARRARRVNRRPGDAKPDRPAEAPPKPADERRSQASPDREPNDV